MKNYFFKEKSLFRDLGGGVRRRIAANEGGLMVCQLEMEEGAIGALHQHPHEQMTYILAGEFEFTIGNEVKVVKSGDVLYKQPNIIHGAKCLKKGTFLDIFTPQREDFIAHEAKFNKDGK